MKVRQKGFGLEAAKKSKDFGPNKDCLVPKGPDSEPIPHVGACGNHVISKPRRVKTKPKSSAEDRRIYQLPLNGGPPAPWKAHIGVVEEEDIARGHLGSAVKLLEQTAVRPEQSVSKRLGPLKRAVGAAAINHDHLVKPGKAQVPQGLGRSSLLIEHGDKR